MKSRRPARLVLNLFLHKFFFSKRWLPSLGNIFSKKIIKLVLLSQSLTWILRDPCSLSVWLVLVVLCPFIIDRPLDSFFWRIKDGASLRPANLFLFSTASTRCRLQYLAIRLLRTCRINGRILTEEEKILQLFAILLLCYAISIFWFSSESLKMQKQAALQQFKLKLHHVQWKTRSRIFSTKLFNLPNFAASRWARMRRDSVA